MKHLVHIIILSAMAALVWGCADPTPSQAEFAALPEYGWPYADTVHLDIPTADSVAVGHLAVTVRHTDGYLYRNLWLEVLTPLADTVVADTINVELADSYGRWYGRGVGVSYVHTDTLPRRVCLTRGRAVGVRHIMRVDTLTDVEQIGLTFIPD